MKKLVFSLVVALFAMTSISAQRLFTRDGKIYFNATSENSPEKIEAAHTGGTFVLDVPTGKVEMAVLIKGFYMEKALMQEHFNENYMESSKFPKASFKGALTDLTAVNFAADGNYAATVSGQLTIHGVTQNVSTPVNFKISGGQVSATCNFSVILKDYGIDIPSLVADKLANQASISIAVESLKPL